MEVKVKFNDINVKEEKEKTLVKILMLKGEKGDSVSAEWGTITGNITDQADLKNALDSKANQSEVTQALNQKANSSDLNNYYNKSQIDTALGSKIGTEDIVDTLDSTSSDKVLSANQGRVLKEFYDNLQKQIITPEQFGAKGDGITDDSQAINNAFEYVRSSKGIVSFITNKIYKIDSPIYIPQGCSLYGNGCTILSSINNGYAIYVNSSSEDNNTQAVGRSFSIVEHFNLTSTNENFIEEANGIHFACHGIVQYIQFYKIDKCVRFSHPLYVDKFAIKFCNASTRTLSSNYAFDIGDNGDAHIIDNVQETASGATSENQTKLIYIGSYILNSMVSNIVGNGLINVRGECELSNIMLTYYGKINVETSHKNITIKNVYASTDYIKNGRIHSKGNHILNLYNCRFINSTLNNEYATGIPVTYENTDHIYLNQCSIGNRINANSSNYGTIDMSGLYGYDMINSNLKNKNADFSTSHNTFSLLADIPGTLNGTYTYVSRVIYDTDRLIGRAGTREKTIETINHGIRCSNFSKNIPIYLTREDSNGNVVSAYIYPTNNLFVDQGNNVSGYEWSSNLLDVSNLNTNFNKLKFNDINVIAYTDNNFSIPNGTWIKNDLIFANDGIYKYNGSTWNAI